MTQVPQRGGPDPTLILILVGVIAVAGLTYWRMRPETHAAPPHREPTRAEAWLEVAERGCEKGKVDGFLAGHPPPEDNAGYAAYCHAIADDIDGARRVLDADGAPRRALEKFFELTHRVADRSPEKELQMGDAMELVSQRSPNNYMAIYHSGMVAFKREDMPLARRRLQQFLDLYKKKGSFYAKAKKTLALIPPPRDAGVDAVPELRDEVP